MPSTDRHRSDDELLAAVERRAAFLWMRRRVAAASAAVVVVLGAAVPVLAQRLGADVEHVEAALPSGPTSTQPAPAPTVTTTPPTTAPTPTTRPVRDPQPPTTSSTAPAGAVAGSDGPTGPRVTVGISDTTPQAGDVVRFEITVSDSDADTVAYGVDYGDGVVERGVTEELPCDGSEGGTSGAGASQEWTAEHVFVEPGAVTVVVTGTSDGCDVDETRDTVEIAVTVGGDALSKWENSVDGLALQVYAADPDPGAGDAVTYVARWQIDSGSASAFTWDPGDGGSRVTWAAGIACEPGEPEPDPPSAGEEQWEYTYQQPGTFSASVRVESAGCDAPLLEVTVEFDVVVD